MQVGAQLSGTHGMTSVAEDVSLNTGVPNHAAQIH